MTLVHFKYSDSYRNPTKGNLAFMPHRRHAANETEILPKPFTVSLDGGEARVDLEPNTESWVWVITEYFGSDRVSRYYTIPEQDGVIDHTELIEISPSSLPAAYNAVEPVWWATMRQYKNAVSDNLLQSGVAIERAETAVEVAETAVEETQHNQSLALAYRNESRKHSYDSRGYRDESREARDKAEEYRDDVLHGPNTAADRAEAAQIGSETARDEAVTARDEAVTARDESVEARDESVTAQSGSETARDEAVTARDEAADMVENEIRGPQGERGPQGKRGPQGSQGETGEHGSKGDKGDTGAPGKDYTPTTWTNVKLINGWENYNGLQSEKTSYAEQPHGYLLRGTIRNGVVGETIFTLPTDVSTQKQMAVTNGDGKVGVITVNDEGEVRVNTEDGSVFYLSLNGIFIVKA